MNTAEYNKLDLAENLSYHELLCNIVTLVYYRREVTSYEKIKSFSGKLFELTGYSEFDFNNDLRLWEKNIHEEDLERVKTELIEIFERENFELVYRWKCADGKYKWFYDKAELIKDKDGNPKEILGLWIDINERKLAEKEFEFNRLLTQKILRTIPGILLIIDLKDDRIIYSNYSESSSLGYNEEEILKYGNNFISEILDEEDKWKLKKLIFELNNLPDGNVKETEVRIKDKDGKLNWFNIKLTIFTRDENNKAKQLIGLLENVQESKVIKDKLEESEQSYKNLFNTIGDAIFIQDYNGVFIDVNAGAVRTFGYSRDELLNKNSKFIGCTENNNFDEIEKKLELAKVDIAQKIEFIGRKKDGSKLLTEVQIYKGVYSGSEVIISHLRDITERKKNELKMQSALSEKNVLLREVHHRVKNNLQAMIYLIEMQIDKLEDKNVQLFLRELQEQARTMSLVYEQLYQSDHLAEVDMEGYLKNLTSNVLQALASGKEIIFNVEAENVLLDVETAMPCGLIINELLTNSLKYAFNDLQGRTPKINVKLSRKNNLIEIIVMDNGKGIPQNYDWENAESLGLKLVNFWVKYQLSGTIELDTSIGSKFIIKFAHD